MCGLTFELGLVFGTVEDDLCARREGCFLNTAINDFVDTEHLDSALAFGKISGDAFLIDDDIAYNGSGEQASM